MAKHLLREDNFGFTLFIKGRQIKNILGLVQNSFNRFCPQRQLISPRFCLAIKVLNFPYLSPSHVVFPKNGIPRFLGISRKNWDFRQNIWISGSPCWNPHKSAPFFAKSRYLENRMGRALIRSQINEKYSCFIASTFRTVAKFQGFFNLTLYPFHKLDFVA